MVLPHLLARRRERDHLSAANVCLDWLRCVASVYLRWSKARSLAISSSRPTALASSVVVEFLLDKDPDTYVWQSDGVQHPGGGLAETGTGSSFHGLERQALGNKSTQTVQVHQVGEFQAITKSAAGSDDGITKAKRADGHAQVNISQGPAGVGSALGSHFVQEDNMKPPRA